MADMQMFPKTVEEFMEEYKMVDEDHVYSNGIEYVPIFRMKQWFEHILSTQSELEKNSKELEKNSKELENKNGELISRQDAIDEIDEWIKAFRENGHKESAADACLIQDGIIHLPSAQMDRDIPVKPIETTDKAWGIPKKQAVCPKCDCYLSHISFLGDYKGKRITYCETCGQAIDWEGWDYDE